MMKAIVDFVEILFIASAIVIFTWFFVVEPLEVTGNSMEPTLRTKEQILAEKFSINFKEINRGDILVIRSPANKNIFLIKRVIGLPDEKIKIEDGNVYINENRLAEPYLKNLNNTQSKNAFEEGEIYIIPEDSYFLMGDNREESSDSRDFGAVKKDLIVGKAIVVYKPFENLRVLKHIDPLLLTVLINKSYYTTYL